MIDCPVGAILSAAAERLGEPPLAELARGLAEPVRVGVWGRPGAGRSTVARALRGAGLAAVESAVSESAGVDVYVYVAVETLTAEDRAALAGVVRPGVAVLAKADLAGFGGAGPLSVSARRCAALERETGVPVLPLAALVAAAGSDPGALDDRLFGAVRSLARGEVPAGPRDRLLAELDLFGAAVAVRAVRAGAGRDGVARALREASGVDAVLAEIERFSREVRYRRAAAALRTLNGAAAARPGVAGLLAGDAMAEARMSLASAVLVAAGPEGDDGGSDPLPQAVGWQRYASGPVTDLHRACARDMVRGLLRRWSRESGSW